MRKLLAILLTGSMALSCASCGFTSTNQVFVEPSYDVSSLLLENLNTFSSSYETSINAADYLKDISIKYEEASSDESKYLSSENYQLFYDSSLDCITDYLEAVANEALLENGICNEDYEIINYEMASTEYVETILSMSLDEYATEVLDIIPSYDEVCSLYGFTKEETSASVAPSGVTPVGVENEISTNMTLSIDGNTPINVRGMEYLYENQTLISLRDLAYALNSTSKQFNIEVSATEVSITKGLSYSGLGVEATGFLGLDGESLIDGSLYGASAKLNNIEVDEEPVRYYNFIMNIDGYYDCYMRVLDAAMLFDLEITQSGSNDWAINTDGSFTVPVSEIEESSYFDSIHACLIGDASTEEIYYGSDYDSAYAIASITKLMNYIVLADALSSGSVSLNDYVTFSENVALLSNSDDGLGVFYQGYGATLEELIYAMLLPSSNEAALAIAEFVAGSEDEYVALMNEKADELGLDSATFYTCNGLPYYSDTIAPRKLQSYMSARDLFTMISYLVNTYPEVTNYTSTKSVFLSSLNYEVKNTNPLLYNMDGILGLKSGTTNAAGCCQTIYTIVTDSDGVEHKLVAIELGAETSMERNSYIEILTRLGIQIIKNTSGLSVSSDRQPPKDLDQFIKLIVNRMQ